MDNWPLFVAGGAVLTVGLAGLVVTLARFRRLRAPAAVPAVIGCLLLLLAAGFDLLWWQVVYRRALDAADPDYDRLNTLSTVGYLTEAALTVLGIAALLVAVHAGRTAAGRTASRTAAGSQTAVSQTANGQQVVQQGGQPAGRQADRPAGRQAGQPAAQQPHWGDQPPYPGHVPPAGPPPVAAGGSTPPRQAGPSDWRSTSGVWSMPPGAFDEPPEQHRR